MLPTLIVCHTLTTASPTAFKGFFQQHVLAEKAAVVEVTCPSSSTLLTPQASLAIRRSFFYQHLLFFLTCLDSNVKRYTGEWLYALCDQNGTLYPVQIIFRAIHSNPLMHRLDLPAAEYTQRTGIGNAIGLLRSKGLA